MNKSSICLALVLLAGSAFAQEGAGDIDEDSRELGDVVVSASGLYRACQLDQALAGPAGMRLTEQEGMQALLCNAYLAGAMKAASLSSGFSSPDKSMHFCAPREETTLRDLRDAIVSTGSRNQQLIAPGAPIDSLLIVTLASFSACRPTVR